MDYDSVKIEGPLDLGPMFQGVAEGDLQAFQDVWMPNHKMYINKPQIKNDLELLTRGTRDQTAYGLTVPTYMGVESIADLNEWARTRSSASSRARRSCPRSRTWSSPTTTWT